MKEPRGQKIRGSKYVRDYCNRCGAPIRIREADFNPHFNLNHCDDCFGAHPPAPHHGLTKRQRSALQKTDS